MLHQIYTYTRLFTECAHSGHCTHCSHVGLLSFIGGGGGNMIASIFILTSEQAKNFQQFSSRKERSSPELPLL